MLESIFSAPVHDKIRQITTRRWLWLLILFLMTGTLEILLYRLDFLQLSPLPWLTSSSLSDINATADSILPTETTSHNYRVVYPHKYQFILDEPDKCRQKRPFLVLLIPVAPQYSETRNIIRSTWGKEDTVLGQVVSYYFLLGLSKGENETGPIQQQVLQESQKHHDILQSDFLDSYYNLTIKTMVMFEWFNSHCPKTPYAMKIDSDMFLNVHKLVGMLLKAPRRRYMTGMVARNALVLRDQNSKWFLPESVFSESVYPPYAMGLGYVFSLDISKRLVEAAAHVKTVYIEDVYVGLCMRYLGITLTDPPGGLFIGTKPRFTSGCYWTSVITTILQDSKQISDVWGTYQKQKNSGC